MKKAENTGNYIDISFSNKRNNVFLLLLYKSYYLNLVTFAVAPLAGAWVEIILVLEKIQDKYVAPLAGAWVEITSYSFTLVSGAVAPLAGAWVEITITGKVADIAGASLPSRERGLKSWAVPFLISSSLPVAPLAGAWVEISSKRYKTIGHNVAPLAGAWVEIDRAFRGMEIFGVAPLAGAWVEI